MKLSIIIPCYNEPETIEQAIERTLAAPLLSFAREVIVVDDGSNEATKQAIEAAKRAHPELVVITLAQNSGKGAALKRGFAAASGDYLAVMDADLEYDPEDLEQLLLPIERGEAEVVFGSRQLAENNVSGRFFYYWGGRLVNGLFNLAFKTRLSDLTVCTKLFPRSLVPQLEAQPADDFVFDAIEFSAVLARQKVAQVPVRYRARDIAHGKKLRAKDGVRMALRILELALGRFAEVARYALVGGSAMLLNIFILYVLTSLLGLWYLFAETAAFVIAVAFNFLLQKHFAFRDRQGKNSAQASAFFLINIFNLAINTLLLYLFVEYLGLWYIAGQVLASALIAFESYFAYRYLFR